MMHYTVYMRAETLKDGADNDAGVQQSSNVNHPGQTETVFININVQRL